MDGEKEATQEKQDGDSGGGDGRRSVIPANESRAPFGRKQQFLFKTLCGLTGYMELKEKHI